VDDAPTASAGPDQVVNERELVQLTGEGVDPENQSLTYEWVQTGGPTVELSDPHAAQPTFTTPELAHDTDLTFELRVSDGTNTSVATTTIHVNAVDDAPVIRAGPDQTVNERDIVQLTGEGVDPENQHLLYEWVQTGGPTVQLSDPHATSPTFTAPDLEHDTDLTFELYVTDGTNTTTATTVVHVSATQETPVVSPDPVTPTTPPDNTHPADDTPPEPVNDTPATAPNADTPTTPMDVVTPATPEEPATPATPTEPTIPVDSTTNDASPVAPAIPGTLPTATPAAESTGGTATDAPVGTGQGSDAPASPSSSQGSPWDGGETLRVLDPLADHRGIAGPASLEGVQTAGIAYEAVPAADAPSTAPAADFDLTVEPLAAPQASELTVATTGLSFQETFTAQKDVTLETDAATDLGLAEEQAGKSRFVPAAGQPVPDDSAETAGNTGAGGPADGDDVAAGGQDSIWAALWGLLRGWSGSRTDATSAAAERATSEEQRNQRR
jgi:hypothetical protein